MGFGQSSGRHGGICFVVSNQLNKFISNFKNLSDRFKYVDILVPQPGAHSTSPVRFVIAHGPTNPLVQSNPTIRDNFYDSLSRAWTSYARRTIVIGLGDFNSKIGICTPGDVATCIGPYS